MKNELKTLYNIFLKVLAENNNRPYRIRKDFSSFEDEKRFFLEKIFDFSQKYPNIDMEIYFNAPYKIWRDSSFYDLKFYTTRKSLIAYTQYKKQLINKHCDDDYQLHRVLEGFKFIRDFCSEKNISPKDYIEHSENSMFSFMNHLKDGKISIYCLFAFENFKPLFRDNIDSELKNIMFGDLYCDYDIMYRQYITSKKCKEFSKKCLQKIETHATIQL